MNLGKDSLAEERRENFDLGYNENVSNHDGPIQRSENQVKPVMEKRYEKTGTGSIAGQRKTPCAVDLEPSRRPLHRGFLEMGREPADSLEGCLGRVSRSIKVHRT